MKLIFYFFATIALSISCNNLKKEGKKEIVLLKGKAEFGNNLNIKSESNDKNLPSSLLEYIRKELKQYSIPTTKDYVPLWHDFLEGDFSPFIASSDFNNDGNIDYAIVLKKKESNKVALFVFNTIKNGYLNYQLEEYSLKEKGIETVISVEKRGKWVAMDKTINVTCDGILVKLIEESLSWAFYWDGQRYEKFLYD